MYYKQVQILKKKGYIYFSNRHRYTCIVFILVLFDKEPQNLDIYQDQSGLNYKV